MASFGAKLKQERELRKISLDEISRSTKIGTRLLRALEEEHLDQLPGGIFNKGFIRAYARALGMDEEEIVADYVAATTTRLPVGRSGNPEETLAELRTQEDAKSSGLPWGTLAVVLLIVALGLAVWGLYSRQSTSTENATTTPASSPTGETAKPAAPTPTAARDLGGSGKTSAEAPPAEVPKHEERPVKPTNQPVPSQTSTLPAAASNQPLPPVSSGNTFRVTIKAREDSWMSITVDGEVTIQRTLAAGAQKTVEAQHEIVVKAGNVGGLDFAFNGKKLPSEGNSGEVKTLSFDANGLISAVARPTTPEQAPTPVAPEEAPAQPQ